VTLAKTIARTFGIKRFRGLTQVLCPSDPILEEVGKTIRHSSLHLGAQNIGAAVRGAATGEISAQDLRQLGCRYVIIGHSERRARGETDAVITKKLQIAAANGLVPILCVGEPRAARERHRHYAFVENQLRRALSRFRASRLLIAYEPVWAISQNGRSRGACSPERADEMRRMIIHTARRFHDTAERGFSVVYGGSVTGANIRHYVHRGGFDGALVGFASTKLREYGTMIRGITGG